MRRRFLGSLVAVILLTVLFNATTSFACGPFSLNAIFVYTVHPAYPLERFAGGEVGVVQPTYARSYLYVAYRHLGGAGLSKHEQEIISELWKERLNYSGDLGDQDRRRRGKNAHRWARSEEHTSELQSRQYL